MKTISVVTPCYNEEGNVLEVYERVRNLMLSLGKYRYEHIFIDNASRDTTFAVLREIAAADSNVKVIRNARNFGHVRSPMHALLQASGDAVVVLMSDLQDPPEVLAQLLEEWEKGVPIVIAVKHESRESAPMFMVRKLFGFGRIAAFVVCASLVRQFEFVQNVWVNDPNFHELGNEHDPMIGIQDGTFDFTIPKRPIRKKIKGLPAFTTVKGGAYFFLPGIKALEYLAAVGG